MKYAVTALSLIVFFVFLRTAPPTIYMGDSGEIAAAAYTLGIGHPPGYPAYMMCARIFSLIPLGDIAFRINIFAAFLSVIVFVVLLMASREFINMAGMNKTGKNSRRAASIIAPALFLFSGAFWFQGTQAKGGIYVFTAMVISISILYALKFFNSGKNKYMLLSLYSAGFMVPAHPSAALFALSVSAAVIYHSYQKGISSRMIAAGAGLFLAGFISPYLYLFIRAGAGPLVNWAGLNSVQDVIDHIMRKTYSAAAKVPEPAVLLFRFQKYMEQLASNYGILMMLFFYGMYMLFRAQRIFFFLILAFIIINTGALVYAADTQANFTRSAGLPMSLYLSRGFYLANDIVPVIIAALGLSGLFGVMTARTPLTGRYMLPSAAAVFILAIFLNYRVNDLSLKFHAYDHGMNILKTLQKDDRLFSRGDCPSFNLAYLKYVKKFRTEQKIYGRDRALLDRSVYAGAQAQAEAVENSILAENPGKVFYTDKVDNRDFDMRSVQYGILYKAVQGKIEPDGSENFFRMYSIRDYFRAKNLDVFYRDYIAKYITARAVYAVMQNDLNLSKMYLKMADEIGGKSAVTVIDIINICYSGLNDRKAEIYFLKRLCEMNPYDMETLDLLMDLYVNYNGREALNWIKLHYPKIPDVRGKEGIRKQMEDLAREIGA